MFGIWWTKIGNGLREGHEQSLTARGYETELIGMDAGKWTDAL